MKYIAPVFLMSLLLAGCAAINENRKQATLNEAMLLYEKAIRWGDFAAADRFRRPQAGSPQPAARLERIRIASYRQIGMRALADDNEVMVSVQIDYYHHDAPRLYSVTDEQRWIYDPETPGWYISTPLPVFR